MNERIDELAKECFVVTGSVYTDHFAYWKFAELIINECANIAGHPAPGAYTSIGHQIKKHFGIE